MYNVRTKIQFTKLLIQKMSINSPKSKKYEKNQNENPGLNELCVVNVSADHCVFFILFTTCFTCKYYFILITIFNITR